MDTLKTVEDVMKWTVTEKAKVMLVRNIVNGDLKLTDPELVAYLKTQISQLETPKPETTKPTSDPSNDVIYSANNIVTNMVAFNGHICFTFNGSGYLYKYYTTTSQMGFVNSKSENITCLAVGNGYLYSGDDMGQIIVWDTDLKVVSQFNIPDKFHVTAMYATDGKLYVGNNQGQLYMFDSEGTNRISFSTQLPGPVTHITKFDKFIVWTSERKYHLDSLDQSYHHFSSGTTTGKIRLLLIEDGNLSIYTTAGRVRINSAGMNFDNDGTSEMYGIFYYDFQHVLNHNGHILNARDNAIFNKNRDTIVSHTTKSKNSNDPIVAVIHNNKLYSSGSDCKIKVTNL